METPSDNVDFDYDTFKLRLTTYLQSLFRIYVRVYDVEGDYFLNIDENIREELVFSSTEINEVRSVAIQIFEILIANSNLGVLEIIKKGRFPFIDDMKTRAAVKSLLEVINPKGKYLLTDGATIANFSSDIIEGYNFALINKQSEEDEYEDFDSEYDYFSDNSNSFGSINWFLSDTPLDDLPDDDEPDYR